jgi:hypothetical protein
MRPSDANRKKDYKKGIDAEEARRKRDDNIIQSRKDKRDETLQKKRMTFQPASGSNFAMSDSTGQAMASGSKVRPQPSTDSNNS